MTRVRKVTEVVGRRINARRTTAMVDGRPTVATLCLASKEKRGCRLDAEGAVGVKLLLDPAATCDVCGRPFGEGRSAEPGRRLWLESFA